MLFPYFKYLFVYWCWRMIFPLLFHITLLYHIYGIQRFFKSCVKSSGSMGITKGFPGTAPPSSCLNFLIISAIATSPNHLMPSFPVIWVNIISMALFKYNVTSSFSSFWFFMKLFLCCTEGYYFPSNIISIFSMPAPSADILGVWFSI